jgi:hypothetical protein
VERTSSKVEDKARLRLATTTWTTKCEISKSILCLTVADVSGFTQRSRVVDSLKVDQDEVDERWISNRERKRGGRVPSSLSPAASGLQASG